jgi:LPXTG-site transpeptidase (sortase) family protein
MNVRWKRSHIVEMILLLTGIVCLGVFLWDQVDTRLEQRQADAELQRQIESTESQARSREAEPVRKRLKRGEVVGRVEIPRLKIAAVVRSGVDDKTLKRAVGHVPSTALPGQPGNVGLAAHRDSFFRNLSGVRNGDTIRIVTPEGSFAYQVESTSIVTPKNVEVLDPTKENALTLVTCYPFNYVGSAPKRFIVRAKQIADTQTAAGL